MTFSPFPKPDEDRAPPSIIEFPTMTVRWSSHGVRRDILKAAFSDWFGIESAHSEVLLVLFDNQGQILNWQAIAKAADSHRPPNQHALHERLRRLRQAMDSEAIDCHQGQGYCLTEVGIAECRKALSLMGAQLAAIAGEEFIEEQIGTYGSGAAKVISAEPVQEKRRRRA